MSTHDEKVCLKVRLTVEEKAKLEHDAALCGLTLKFLYRLAEGRHFFTECRPSLSKKSAVGQTFSYL